MKTYTVFFEIYGKKMKAKIEAASKDHAKDLIKEKVIFHKVEDDMDELFKGAKDLFDFLGIKPK